MILVKKIHWNFLETASDQKTTTFSLILCEYCTNPNESRYGTMTETWNFQLSSHTSSTASCFRIIPSYNLETSTLTNLLPTNNSAKNSQTGSNIYSNYCRNCNKNCIAEFSWRAIFDIMFLVWGVFSQDCSQWLFWLLHPWDENHLISNIFKFYMSGNYRFASSDLIRQWSMWRDLRWFRN